MSGRYFNARMRMYGDRPLIGQEETPADAFAVAKEAQRTTQRLCINLAWILPVVFLIALGAILLAGIHGNSQSRTNEQTSDKLMILMSNVTNLKSQIDQVDSIVTVNEVPGDTLKNLNLVAGANINITNDASTHTITISSSGGGNDTGLLTLSGVEGDGARNIDIVAGANVVVTPNPGSNSITISATGANGTVGVTTINGVPADLSGNLDLMAGPGIDITPASPGMNDITIASDITLSSAGGDETLVNDDTLPSFALKGLSAGTDIVLVSNATAVTISAAVPLTNVTNVGATSLVSDGTGPELALLGLAAGPGIALSANATDVEISNTGVLTVEGQSPDGSGNINLTPVGPLSITPGPGANEITFTNTAGAAFSGAGINVTAGTVHDFMALHFLDNPGPAAPGVCNAAIVDCTGCQRYGVDWVYQAAIPGFPPIPALCKPDNLMNQIPSSNSPYGRMSTFLPSFTPGAGDWATNNVGYVDRPCATCFETYGIVIRPDNPITYARTGLFHVRASIWISGVSITVGQTYGVHVGFCVGVGSICQIPGPNTNVASFEITNNFPPSSSNDMQFEISTYIDTADPSYTPGLNQVTPLVKVDFPVLFPFTAAGLLIEVEVNQVHSYQSPPTL